MDILNPLSYPGWNEFLLNTPGASFFHSSAWARVLAGSYGYRPLYFTKINKGRLKDLLPLMEVDSFLTGKRGVSLPFTDYCEILTDGALQNQNVMHTLIDCGGRRGWKSVELRGGNGLSHDMPSSVYYGHSLSLSPDEEAVFSTFRDSTRRNIKKAVMEGVAATIDTSLNAVREFYQLNCLTRREHGLPPQPYRFFQKIHEHVLSRGLGMVVLASHGGKTVAGAMYFHFGDMAIYKYGASDRKYQHLRANNLVMWEAIRWYCRNGYRNLCFGRTDPENKGLLQFKRGWGTRERTIRYYRYDLVQKTFVQDNSRLKGFQKKVFQVFPVPMLRLIGELLFKHIG